MLKSIGKQFRRPSGFLGTIISKLMIKGNHPIYIKMNDCLGIINNDHVLEIGYGPGTGLRYIIENNNHAKYEGIDFSELMLQKASKTNKKFIQEGKVKLWLGDFLFSKELDSIYDKIFCINVVYFWNDLNVPFKKIHSLLNSQGSFCFFMAKNTDLDRLKFTVNDIFNKYTIEQVTNALKQAGFTSIEYSFDKGYFVIAHK